MSQSNTRVGDIRVLAGEALTGMEDRLVKLTHDSGVAEVQRNNRSRRARRRARMQALTMLAAAPGVVTSFR